MMEGLLPPEAVELLSPERVSPALLALVADNAPNRTILCSGAGSVEAAHISLTKGIYVGAKAEAAEAILSRLEEISDRSDDTIPYEGFDQSKLELAKAGFLRATIAG